MKSLILTTVLLTLSSAVNAESIYCSFAPSSFTVIYNSEDNKISITSPAAGTIETTAHVSFQKDGILKILGERTSHYLEVNLTKEGSDGVSNFIYPFEGVLSGHIHGGCETDALKKQAPKY